MFDGLIGTVEFSVDLLARGPAGRIVGRMVHVMNSMRSAESIDAVTSVLGRVSSLDDDRLPVKVELLRLACLCTRQGRRRRHASRRAGERRARMRRKAANAVRFKKTGKQIF